MQIPVYAQKCEVKYFNKDAIDVTYLYTMITTKNIKKSKNHGKYLKKLKAVKIPVKIQKLVTVKRNLLKSLKRLHGQFGTINFIIMN